MIKMSVFVAPLTAYKLRVFLVYILAYVFFYILPNIFPFSTPNFLPMVQIDRAIPFLPWTFLVYISDYLLILVTVTLQPTQQIFKALARQAFGVLFICGTFFILYPTTYPRPVYPESLNTAYGFAMGLVKWADTPNNCFPSMHVALTGIAAWSIRGIHPRAFPFFVVWAITIFVSTLTTKQHYFIDVIGGIAVTAFVLIMTWALFERGSAPSTRTEASLN